MFKVGDKVVVTDVTLHARRQIGDAGEIVRIFADSDYSHLYFVKFEDGICDVMAFSENEIALLEPKVAASETDGAPTSRIIPDDDNREDYPLFDVLFGYFPAAMCELSRWSKVGNEQHNPGEELHWAREKSTDHRNKIMRHLMDYDQKDSNGFYEAIPLLWRAAALAQELLEKDGWPEGRNARRKG